MQRKLIFASHHQLAAGLKDTVDFITNGAADITAVCAYMDNQPVDNLVNAVMGKIDPTDDVIILTDMTAGSVNQKFFPYRTRPHTHIISGMNLPLALGFAMEPAEQYLTDERVSALIREAQTAIVDVNALNLEADDEDE